MRRGTACLAAWANDWAVVLIESHRSNPLSRL